MSQPENQPKRLHRPQMSSMAAVLIVALVTIPLFVWWVTASSDNDAVSPAVLESAEDGGDPQGTDTDQTLQNDSPTPVQPDATAPDATPGTPASDGNAPAPATNP